MNRSENDQNYQFLREENLRLKLAVEELSILNELATAISSTNDLDQVVNLIVKKCINHFKVEQGAVLLLDKKDLVTFHTHLREFETQKQGVPLRFNTELTGWMLKYQQPLLSNDLKSDDRFKSTEKDDFPIRSILAVPLVQKANMLGLLIVFNKHNPEGFTEDDKRLLTIIAAQSAQVIEAARLYREEQQYLLVQQDMHMARQIQQNLLPSVVPEIEKYAAAGVSIPARDVGGDYYDFIRQKDGQIAFCVGDVSGKGMPAALLMANLQATLRGQTITCACARDCLERSNYLLYQSTDSEKYATLFYGILDPERHNLSYANAGHNYPYYISSDGKIERLKTIGIPLGFMEDFQFSEHTISLKQDDLLVLYSDGVTEAMNQLEEEFGEDRLEKILLECKTEHPKDIIDRVIRSVREHSGDNPQTDDITLLVIKRMI